VREQTSNSPVDKRISVLVVDDHPLYRESISRLINNQPEMSVVGEAADGREALNLIREIGPDVCVLDYHLPELDGEHVIEMMRREHLETKALILSGSGESEVVFAMIEAGAGGFLLKTSSASEIRNAIIDIAQGGTVLPEEFHGGLAAEIRARHRKDKPDLTEREIEILQGIAQGFSAAELGDRLGLAPSTVKTHLTRIYDKLGVSERAAAVAQAMRLGILD
jgi:two-component system nitrate/nitrite response regulator NarL